MKRYVVGFAFDVTESRVALISKRRPEWQAGKLNGIGGHIEPGETPLQAMVREFEEEASGEAAWSLFALLSGNGFEVWFFRGTTEDELESGTDEQVVWVRPDELPANVVPNLRWLVPMARVQQGHDWPLRIYERTALDTEAVA